MKKLLILALTSAFVAAANADNPNQFGVALAGLSNAVWRQDNQPVERAYTGSVIGIDEEASSPLVLSPTTGFTAPDPQVKTVVTVEATFTAISDSLESPGDDAKTALTVAKDSNDTPHYYYWNPASEAENKWTLLGTTATPNTEQAVTVVIELDNSTVGATTAKFTIGNATAVTVPLSSVTTLNGLAFAGTGDLTSVAATVTPAYAEYAGTRYETTAAAVAARTTAGDSTDIKLFDQGAGVQLPTDASKYYYSKTSGNNTVLGVFPSSGAGTAASPYTIGTLAELKAFQQYVAAGFTTQGKTFAQTNDIALTEAWPGIGIQNGKDLVTSETAADVKAFDDGAFCGTFDGQNHTISNFQMIGKGDNAEGLDYCGFFNSTYGATIKNLKIQYAGALFAADTTASTKESGATFVGVAKGSTLQNLTTIAGTVSCSKGFGGIVGYLMGTTVDSCTNNLNMTSLANNKCGGIAMICQKADCSISNCKNTGTMTTGSGEHGGIIGYTDTITISDCENTAACKMFYHHGGTVTLSGTNKGNATVASYTGVATPGLNFATVDGNVATFVADNALEAGGAYKVMAAGATAIANLAAKDDYISFDTALVATEDTKPTFNITAGAGLVAKPTTSGTVTTYTADKGYEVVSTAETTLVAIPANCNAAGLISTDNRDTGDILKVYSKGDKCYYTWTLTGAKGTWDPLQTWVINGEAAATSHSKPASEVALSAGQAAWLTRTSAASKNAKIILAVVAAGNTIPATVEKGYNLVAPPPKAGADTITIDEVVADDATGKDKVFIPAEGKAPYNLDFKDGNWGYDKYTIENGKLKKVRITEVTIPAGTGFFYINNGDAAKSVTLGSED